MPISIKDPEADRLARRLATETGLSITQAVIGALKSKLREVERRNSRTRDLHADIMEIGRQCAALPDLDRHQEDFILGYDDQGIPQT